MKKLLCIVFFLAPFPISGLQAQSSPELSGIYQKLILGVDSAQGVITGYYHEVYEPPNLPYLECSFYLFGKKEGGRYAVQAWSPGEKKLKVTTGELTFLSAGYNKPSVLLKLESLDRDCMAIQPNLSKGQGAFFDLKKSGAWKEVRMVANPKSPYYQAADLSAPTRDTAKRGTVLTVTETRSEFVRVQANEKPKGWIREGDLYPSAPSGESAKPAPPAADQLPDPPAKKSSPPVVLEKQADVRDLPTPKPTSDLESKDALLKRLKALSSEAFAMALQVLKNPQRRHDFLAKRIEMQKDFNGLVTLLNTVAPSAYADESREIIEAFLDLQYVERAQPVVSLRLNKAIQGFANPRR